MKVDTCSTYQVGPGGRPLLGIVCFMIFEPQPGFDEAIQVLESQYPLRRIWGKSIIDSEIDQTCVDKPWKILVECGLSKHVAT